MKYQVEIIKRDVYIVEAETEEEARELAFNECDKFFKVDEVFDDEVERAYKKLCNLIFNYIKDEGPVSKQEIQDVFIPWYRYYDISLVLARLQYHNLIIPIQRQGKPDWFIINERN